MEIPAAPTWLGPFKGFEHSFLDCEVLGLENMDGLWLADGWRARGTCWFDYRRLHPVKAFLFFASVFSKTYSRYMEENIDMELRYSTGLKGSPLSHRERRQLWYLMIEADKRGIPYHVWLSGLFDWFARAGWVHPPRPSHMLANQEAHEHAALRWAAATEGITHVARDPWFLVDAFIGHPAQVDHEQWVVDSIRQRNNRDIAISSAIYDLRALRIERAMVEFPEQVEDAIKWSASLTGK